MVGGIYGYSSGYGSFAYNRMAVDPIVRLSSNEPQNNAEIKSLKRSGAMECETCKERKYQDGSDEMVSFKKSEKLRF